MQPTCQLYPAHLPACPPACPHVIEHPPLPCPIVLLQVEQYSRKSALGAKLEQKAVKLHLLPGVLSPQMLDVPICRPLSHIAAVPSHLNSLICCASFPPWVSPPSAPNTSLSCRGQGGADYSLHQAHPQSVPQPAEKQVRGCWLDLWRIGYFLYYQSGLIGQALSVLTVTSR
jgi:hypothetical protein